MMMVYKLTSIPDISLVKYKIMSGNGIDVLREWTDDFLRQWQKYQQFMTSRLILLSSIVLRIEIKINWNYTLFLNMKIRN